MLCNNPRRGPGVIHGDSLLNTEEAARFLRVSEASIRRWSDAGLLPARRVGPRRERRFAEADLLRFLGPPTADMSGSGPNRYPGSLSLGGLSVPLRSHLAPIYSTDAGGLRLAVPFLADGLRARQPCFLVATGPVLERYARALDEEDGVDFAAAVRSGQLTVLPGPGSNLAQAVANLERLFGKALAGGPTVLRLVGEMSCVRHMFASDTEMLDFEEAFDVMAKRFSAVSLCQYDAREFDGQITLRALKAHPDMFQHHLGGFLN
jgi:excisionase family DNA binding protein